MTDKVEMLGVTAPELPPALLSFARDLAELAKAANLRECTAVVRMHHRDGRGRELPDEHYFDGEVQIIYTGLDNRGRPRENLRIEVASKPRVFLLDPNC